MIRINVKDTGITVSGHAQRLPGASPGHNIICAGVSALTLTVARAPLRLNMSNSVCDIIVYRNTFCLVYRKK